MHGNLDIVKRLKEKENLRQFYAKNRKIIENSLNKNNSHKTGYIETSLITLDKYIDSNVNALRADFTKEQLSWLNEIVDLRQLKYSSNSARKKGIRLRKYTLLGMWASGIVGFGVIALFIGLGSWSYIQPLTLSPYEKCQKNESLTLYDYCKEDGTVGDRYEEEQTRLQAECATKGAQWEWIVGRCERIAYNTKQECIDGGLQKLTKDDFGEIVGQDMCQEDGTTKYVSIDIYEDMMQEVCNIKGNISYNTGERIYHIPGDPYYDATVIDENYGEKWFCSEKSAQEAGWRRASRQ
jgi:hypothetical protein